MIVGQATLVCTVIVTPVWMDGRSPDEVRYQVRDTGSSLKGQQEGRLLSISGYRLLQLTRLGLLLIFPLSHAVFIGL